MFNRMIILNLIMNSVILAHHHINDCCVFIIEQAYASFMKGSVSIELQNWKEALELFRQAKWVINLYIFHRTSDQRHINIHVIFGFSIVVNV